MTAREPAPAADEAPAYAWNDQARGGPPDPGSDGTTEADAGARFTHTPESLALRAAPRRVVRFRKSLLIAAAAGTLAMVAGVSWFALNPPGWPLTATGTDLTPARDDAIPEALEGLPHDYGSQPGAPVLGPPLPGDLGRPILAHQRAMAQEAPPPVTAIPVPDPAAEAARAEHQRIAGEAAQARAAPVLMEVSRGAARSGPAESGEARPSAASPAATNDAVNPNRLQQPVSRWQVSAGSTIAASLVTGLNSDLPGLVIAQVTEPVFDSATGRTVLIPQGSRLLGRYDDKIAFGQRRAMVVWDRLVLPDGSSIALDNAPATNAAGFAGLSDRVDFHTWQLLKGIGVSTLLGVGTELSLGEEEADLVRALRESVQSNADRAGQKIVERNLDVAPTIIVRPGHPVRVLVHKDLVLRPWRGSMP